MRRNQPMKLVVRTSVFFVLYYLYILFGLRPELIYHNQSPIYSTSREFLMQHLGLPGDPIRYVAEILSLTFFRPWLGAIVITLAAWAICMGTKALLKALGRKEITSLHLLPLPVLLMLQNEYNHPLNLGMAIALGIWSSVGYIRFATHREWPRTILFWVMCAALFYVAGPGYVLFAVTASLYDIFWARHRILGISGLFLFLIVPYVFAAVFLTLPPDRLYNQLLVPEYNLEPTTMLLSLFFLYPFLVLWFKTSDFLKAKKEEMLRKEQERNEAKAVEETPEPLWSKYFTKSPKKWLHQSLVLLILGSLLVFLTFEGSIRPLIEIDYYAGHKDWDNVLHAADRLPVQSLTLYAWHDINRALYHKGQLPYRMFEYPQSIGMATLMPPEKLSESMQSAMKFSDLFSELGLVNESEHLAFESLSSYGKHPKILKRLIQTNAVKGRVQAARVFLNNLEYFPAAHDWVEHYRPFIESDDPLAEPGLKHTNSIMLRTDYAGLAFTPETVFNWLLKDNPKNEMAFQYLMAHYLLTGQFGKIVENVPRLAYFGKTEIPDLYQQGVLMFIQTSGDQHPNLRGYQLQERVIDRFREFNTTLAAHIDDFDQAAMLMAQDFGDTYWYYCAFALRMAGPATENGEEKEVNADS